jgi:hypothetical protein
MVKKFLAAAAFAGTAFAFAAPASAMTVDAGPVAGKSGATTVAWYCNNNGRHCVRAPRAGYIARNDCNWNGSFCAPIVVAPRVVVRPPVVVAPRVVVRPAPRVVVRPGGVVVRP